MARDDYPDANEDLMTIRHRFQQIVEEKNDAHQRAMSEALAFEWAHRDINLLWNETSRSSLHPAIRQVIFNMLWG